MSKKMTRDEVRSILPRDWDPLCIGDNPNLSDEYDEFLPKLLRLLDAGKSVTAIAAYLVSVENYLEILPRPEEAMQVAARLSGGTS
jgi:hypothetical protein